MGDKQVRRERERERQRQRRECEHSKRGLGLELAPIPRKRGFLRSPCQRARPTRTRSATPRARTTVSEEDKDVVADYLYEVGYEGRVRWRPLLGKVSVRPLFLLDYSPLISIYR